MELRARAEGRAVLVALAAALLLIECARVFFATIYYRNLATLSINASVLWAFAMLAPALLVAAPRAPAWLRVGAPALALVAARLALHVLGEGRTALPVAAIGTAAGLLLLPALLTRATWAPTAVGIAAAFGLDAALLVAGVSADPTASLQGLAVTIPMGLVLLAFALRLPPDEPVESGASRSAIGAGLALGGWIFLEFGVLASAHHVAGWNGARLAAVAVGTVGGLVAGVALAFGRAPAGRAAALGFGGPAAAALLLDHALVHSALLPLLLVAGQAGMVVLLLHAANALAEAPYRRRAAGVLVGSALALVLLFAFAFTFVFAYVPLEALWKGREAVVLFLAFLLVILPVGLGWERARHLRIPPMPPALLAVLVAAPLLVAGLGVVADPPVAPPRAGGELRVLAFNVHQGFNNAGVLDPDVFVDILVAEDADLVALQESDTPRFTSGNLDIVAYAASKAGYHAYRGPPTREQSFGVAILSRHPLHDPAYLPLTSSTDNRFVAKARVVVNGSDVWFYAVHMGLPEVDRSAQIGEILADAERTGARAILAGDFNSCPNGLCSDYEEGTPDRVYARATANFTDAWVAAGGNATDPAASTYDAAAPYVRIDYVFVSSGFRVTDARVVRTPEAVAASDHLPVAADLVLS